MERITYDDGRDHIKDGDLFFIKDKKSLVGFIIRFFTFSRYSHVGFAFWMTVGNRKRLMVVEAQGGAKRRIVNMSFYKGQQIDVICAPASWEDIGSSALDNLNTVKYGWLEALYVGIREFLMNSTKFIVLPRLDLPGETCSEFVAITLKLPYTNISPQKLIEYLTNKGHEVRVRLK